MRRWAAAVVAMALGAAVSGLGPQAAGQAAVPRVAVSAQLPKVTYVHGAHATLTKGAKQLTLAGAPATAAQRRQQALRPHLTTPRVVTATINVSYTNFPPEAQAAFQAAADIWATRIHSSVPITIAADWSDLDAQYQTTGILGAAGPTTDGINFTHAPRANTDYPIAMVNALAGVDFVPATTSGPNPSGAEISASFNSAQPDWYFGTDGNTPVGKYDLESVALHELAHGLGFSSTYEGLTPPSDPNQSIWTDDGLGYFGVYLDGTKPTIFDEFLTDGAGRSPRTSTARRPSGGLCAGATGACAGTVRPPLLPTDASLPSCTRRGSGRTAARSRTWTKTRIRPGTPTP